MPLRGIVLLTFFAASLPVCFVRPFYGILLWVVVAFLNPQSYVWSAAASFPWALGVAIPTLAGFPLFARGGLKNLKSLKVFLIVTLWIWFCITSLVSTNTAMFTHHAADTWSRWQFVSKVLLMTLVTIAIVSTFERLRMLVIVIAGCFGVFVLKCFPFVILTHGSARLYGPEKSMIADNNDFGLALNMTLPLFFFLAQTEEKRWVRRVFGFLFVITIPAIFFTYSRGALIGLLTVSILMFLKSRMRLVLIPVMVLAVLIALVFAPATWKARMDPNQGVDASARERLNAWAFCRHLAADYPITGGGFSTFTPELFDRYAPVATDIHGPHSVYFGVLAEHGFVGLALYLGLVGACFSGARTTAKKARLHGDPLIASYANMFQLSLVGFLTSGIFLGRAYFDYFFTIVACLAVLDKVAESRWAEMASEQAGDEPELVPGSLQLSEAVV